MRAVRRTALGLLAIATLVSVPVAEAASRGVIKGVVVNQSTGHAQPDAKVTLVGALSDGSDPMTRSVVADRKGRYRFDDLPTGEDRFYAIDVVHDGGLFSGTALTLPSDTDEQPVFDTRIKVWDTTTEPDVILIAHNDIFVTPGDGALDVIESVTVNNLSDSAYIGRGMKSGGDSDTPSLGFALPRGAADGGVQILDASLELPALVETDFGFGVTAAIPPGESRVTYRYRVPGSVGSFDLSRTAVYPIVQFSVHAGEGFDIRSNRLAPDGSVTVGGIDYTRWSTSEAVEGGNQLQMIAIQEATGTSGIATAILASVFASVILLGAGIWIGVRRRRRHLPPRSRKTRDELLRSIAELDQRHDAGTIETAAWERARRDLKERLASLGQREVAP